MIERTSAVTVSALYQFSVLLGILLLPVAVLARKVGVHLPMDRPIERLRDAYASHR